MEWVITCNTRMFDIQEAFNELSVIDWKQSANMQVGDKVFIYVGKPIMAICYQCVVIKAAMENQEIDDSKFIKNYENYKKHKKYMRLQLEQKYDEKQFPYSELIDNGLKTLQGPSRVSNELLEFLTTRIACNGR